MKDWQSQAHVKWECKYHVVIIPKYRKKALYGKERWYPFVGQVGGVIKDDLAIQVQAAFGKLLKYASSGVRSSSEEWVRFEL